MEGLRIDEDKDSNNDSNSNASISRNPILSDGDNSNYDGNHENHDNNKFRMQDKPSVKYQKMELWGIVRKRRMTLTKKTILMLTRNHPQSTCIQCVHLLQ